MLGEHDRFKGGGRFFSAEFTKGRHGQAKGLTPQHRWCGRFEGQNMNEVQDR
jgi:hypothetical protein